MRAGTAGWSLALAVALALSPAASQSAAAQDFGKIASDILHRSMPGDRANLTKGDVAAGLKEALGVAEQLSSRRLSAKDGYMGDPAIRIELPGVLGEAHRKLGPFGMAGSLDDLQLRVNRAAEATAPLAGKLVADAIRSMTFEDAMAVLRGGDTAATAYLRRKTEASLRRELRPHFVDALATSGALVTLDTAVSKYGAGLLKTDTKTWLAEQATAGALNGLFYYLAREEQAIRHDPVKRTSEILRKVFGG